MIASVNTKFQAEDLLSLPDEQLFYQAKKICEQYFENKVDVCTIINAKSGNCSMDCAFCSQSSHNNSEINKFPMLSEQELYERIMELSDKGINHIGIVTSGGILSDDDLTKLVNVLSNLPSNILPFICASLGRLSSKQLEKLANCGLRRYHHNLETAQEYYPNICSTQKWSDRKNTVLRAMEVGLEVCSGGLFGLGESWADRISFAFSLKEIGVKNIPMNFLHPHKGLALKNKSPLSSNEALKIIALFRIILPDSTLRICGGRPITFPENQEQIFFVGANALMTGDYLTSKGNAINKDLSMLEKLGLKVFKHA